MRKAQKEQAQELVRQMEDTLFNEIGVEVLVF